MARPKRQGNKPEDVRWVDFLVERHDYAHAVFWYFILGFLHELVHWIVAALCFPPNDAVLRQAFTPSFWYNLLIGRKLEITAVDHDDMFPIPSIMMVRHAGWIASLMIAIWVERSYKRSSNKSSIPQGRMCSLRWAAWITAIEALSTDLFQFEPVPTIFGFSGGSNDTHQGQEDNTLLFYCGNFGMILLHHVWWTNEYSNLSLDMLEKMIQVTMMRGAQSGGVICFHPTKDRYKENDGRYLVQATRTRILNMKRTDLSVLLRRKVYRDNCRFRRSFPNDFIPLYMGHTRFATSSKATLEGTHPHLWTPPSPRRVYNMVNTLANNNDSPENSSLTNIKSREPRSVLVENYVTHNGDFDFYRVNGKAYGLELIQKWLVRVLHHPMPSAVDSNAIAGVFDILRTQGCFGLSARYAICIDLPTSHIDEGGRNSYKPFPTYRQFEKIGLVFEDVLREILKSTPLSVLDETPHLREDFAWRVVSQLAPRQSELMGPALSRYVHDGEDGASLFAFCASTIGAFFDNDLFEATKLFMANAIGSFGLCVTSSLDAQRQICMAARGQTMSVAFYPNKGVVLYGSEQAAVKAGLRVAFPSGNLEMEHSSRDVDKDALRLDLDGKF